MLNFLWRFTNGNVLRKQFVLLGMLRCDGLYYFAKAVMDGRQGKCLLNHVFVKQFDRDRFCKDLFAELKIFI